MTSVNSVTGERAACLSYIDVRGTIRYSVWYFGFILSKALNFKDTDIDVLVVCCISRGVLSADIAHIEFIVL